MALYHTHRPQDFSSIIGQEHIIETIKNQITNDKLAHAYLFSGPRGVGKTTTARVLAKAINCPKEKGSFEPDNDSQDAKEINESRSIDVIEIDAASNTGVDNVRTNIIENAQFKPTKLPYKVFIIDEVHMLSTSAFNALLKIMEEPPSHVLFILATTEPHKIPDTIISRCQRFDFKRIAHKTLIAHLTKIAKEEDVEVEKDVLGRIAFKSDGCARDAVSLLEQVMATGEKKITAEVASYILPVSRQEHVTSFISALISNNATESISALHKDNDNLDYTYFAEQAVQTLRQILLLTANAESAQTADLDAEAKKQLQDLSKSITQSELVALIDILMKRKLQIKTAPLPQLPLELAAIEWCSGGIHHGKPQQVQKQEVQASVKTSSSVPKPAPVVVESVAESPSPQKPEQAAEEIVQVPEETQVETEAPEPIENNGPITKEAVENIWSSFVSSLEKDTPSLVFIIKMAKIESVKGNTVTLSLEYSFHKDKILENTCKTKIQDELTKQLGTKVLLEAIVADKKEKASEENNSELNELASLVGGQVVS
jgi:DNA polymerase III subunit gamma/tau